LQKLFADTASGSIRACHVILLALRDAASNAEPFFERSIHDVCASVDCLMDRSGITFYAL